MTPLAQCAALAGECAAISPATSAEKLAIAFGLVIVGVLVQAAIFAMLDSVPVRHFILHRFWASGRCGRCLQKKYAAAADRAFRKSETHSALTQSIEAQR